MKTLEVLFSPAEFEALARRDLSGTTTVVFDVLRATSTIITALMNGAQAVKPVSTIEEALAERRRDPAVLLAGERDGFRITSRVSGGVEFDLGNSPREFVPEVVDGKLIVMTTTNGTRALRACAGAKQTLAAGFVNLGRLTKWIAAAEPEHLVLVCSGTHEQASFEDTLGAGALCEAVWSLYREADIADSARIARVVYHRASKDLISAAGLARNARRLLALPELREDVAFCLKPQEPQILARLGADGLVRQWDGVQDSV